MEHHHHYNDNTFVGAIVTIGFTVLSYAGNLVSSTGLMMNTVFDKDMLIMMQTIAAFGAIVTASITSFIAVYNFFKSKK